MSAIYREPQDDRVVPLVVPPMSWKEHACEALEIVRRELNLRQPHKFTIGRHRRGSRLFPKNLATNYLEGRFQSKWIWPAGDRVIVYRHYHANLTIAIAQEIERIYLCIVNSIGTKRFVYKEWFRTLEHLGLDITASIEDLEADP